MDNTKFRVYDFNRKEMAQVECWDFKNNGIDVRNAKGKGWYTEITDKTKIMQFTGVLDANDKKIYEGDIVTNETEIVIPDKNGEYDFTGEYKRTRCVVAYDSHWGSFEFTDETNWGKFEVIGNIYENPELIEATK